jgi:hypothetical protein
MNLFRVSLIVAWCMYITLCLVVIDAIGWDGANLFFSDISAGGWRTLFNVDFIIHLLFIAGWVAWKEKYSPSGMLAALLCICGGALFSLLYLLYLSVVNKGNVTKILLGKHADDISFTP